jgi:predicted negative regulator of RcsB-dependent stress response
MSTLDLEEQEQLAALKAWWNKNGTLVVTAIAAVVLAIAGYRGWEWYNQSQAGQAAAIYGELQKAAAAGDAKKARDLSGTLLEGYGRSTYAALGALLSAKLQFESGDLKTARAQLQWVAEKARDPEIQSIGRLRLAAVLLDEKAYDDALKTLDTVPSAPFAGLFAEARGDVLTAQGKRDEARAAYRLALEKLPASESVGREIVQLKLDGLGG